MGVRRTGFPYSFSRFNRNPLTCNLNVRFSERLRKRCPVFGTSSSRLLRDEFEVFAERDFLKLNVFAVGHEFDFNCGIHCAESDFFELCVFALVHKPNPNVLAVGHGFEYNVLSFEGFEVPFCHPGHRSSFPI